MSFASNAPPEALRDPATAQAAVKAVIKSYDQHFAKQETLNLETKLYHTLNITAVWLWKSIAERCRNYRAGSV